MANALVNWDIPLIGGWDDVDNPIEGHIIPFYRALVSDKAEKVQIIAFKDNHAFEKSREDLARVVSNWILSE